MTGWPHVTRMCGAVVKRARVATRVKAVKASRHTRSRTIAANFQSATTRASSLLDLMLSVMILSSFSMRASSRAADMLGVAGSVNISHGSFQHLESEIFSKYFSLKFEIVLL